MGSISQDTGLNEHASYDFNATINNSHVNEPAEPIAVVGMAMRLPGQVRSDEEFWKLLVDKRSALCDVPDDRFNVAAFSDPTGSKSGTFKPSKAYFLQDVDIKQFDTSVFPLSRTELERLDPNQRQLLEVAYECMENSGATSWRGSKIGCYVGVFGEDWEDLNAKETQHRGGYRVTGYSDFVVGNRISYEFDLRGPSMTIKTACSSSLVGLDMACQAIRKGDCDGALICGVSLIFSPTMYIALSDQGVLSPGGVCKTFDSAADGYGRGEAVNAVYIKKLSQALKDGDEIRAVIRGTSVNTDGRTNGMLTPSPVVQEALIRQAYRQAGIEDLSATAFFECHGTGTPVGDPIETTAVANCFGEKGIHITSVKPNVGHSEGAAGITSLIKAILAIEHRQVPPNIHFNNPNPNIPFKEAKLKVPVDVETWPQGRAERVSVNSFGIGGVNAHVVVESLEEYGKYNTQYRNAKRVAGVAPEIDAQTGDVQQLLLLSSNSEAALKQTIEAHKTFAETTTSSLKDVAYTLANRREHKSHRAFAIAGKFNDQTSFEVFGPESTEAAPRVAWIFTGQGAQWPEMGAELIDSNPIFRKSIRSLDAFLAGLPTPPSWTIEDELRKVAGDSRVLRAEFGHPLSIAVQIGLVDILRAYGVKPDWVLGHSSGEMAAAYASGAISATAAMAAATFRGSTSTDEQPGGRPRGAMAAIGLGAREVEPYMEPGVVVACENSHCSVTLSGDTDQVAKVVENVKANCPTVLARFLKVEKAFHSPHMKEYGPSYEQHLKPFIQSLDPTTPFYSSVTGKRLTGAGSLDAHYWRSNMERPVLFNTALRSALNDHGDERFVLIEIGPHPALKGPLGQILRDINRNEITQVATLQRNKICSSSILETVGKLFQQNVSLNFSTIFPAGKIVRNLPRYSWKRDVSYWAEPRVAKEYRFREFAPHDLLGTRVAEVSNENCWRNKLSLEDAPWLQGHEIDGEIVFPGAGYICMIGEAIRQISGDVAFSLKNVSITAGLILEHGKLPEVVTRLTPHNVESDETSVYSFQISSYNGARWIKHCSGEVWGGVDNSVVLETEKPQTLPRAVDASEWYGVLNRIGFNYQGAFRGMRDISSETVKNVAVAAVPTDKNDLTKYAIHPGIIDQCFQLFTVAAYRGLGRNCINVAVPTFIEEIVVRPASKDLDVQASIHTLERGSFVGDLVAQADGQLLLSLKGFKASAMTSAASDDEALPLITQFEWRPHADFIKMKDYMQPRTFIPNEWPMLEELMLLSILDHQENIKLADDAAPHLVKFFKWQQDYIATYHAGKNPFIAKEMRLEDLSREQKVARIDALTKDLLPSHYDGFAIGIHRLFKEAEKLFSGETHALHVLMPDDVLTRLYANGDELLYGDAIRALGHTNPRLRVLEVGAGTGGTTSKVLDALTTSTGQRLYSTYTYTDISAGFFSAAKERFGAFEGIEYKTFDVTKDPTEQQLQKGSYDLVIGYNVVHATPNLQVSLGHLRELLRPSGRIFLQELCPDAKYINYIMGYLSGWWLGDEDDRVDEPYISPARWEKELIAAGFKNPEHVLDGIAPYHQSAGIMASVDIKSKSLTKVSVLAHDANGPYVQDVKSALELQGLGVDVFTFGQELPAQDVISLLDLQADTVHEFTEESFKTMISHLQDLNAKMVWVLGSAQVKCRDPKAAMSIGLARTARNELSAKLFTLEVEPAAAVQDVTKAISDILVRIQHPELDPEDMDPDWEFALVDGKVLVPRLHWQTMSEAFDNTVVAANVSSSKFLTVKTPGLLHTIGWSEETKKPLAEGEVRVKTKAVGLNFRDVLIALGVLDNSTREVGLEGCGIVSEVGPGVSKVAVGDRVIYMSSGCFTTEITLSQVLCVKIDDALTFEQGAGLPCVYATAAMALDDKANLKKGQSILIHSACGGVGLAAIQIAQMLGAEVYCTVSSEEKINYLTNNFNIPRSNIFNSRDSSFLHNVMRATNGRGVDVVLNSLSGDLLHASWKCVAEFGTMIEIGKRDFRRRAKLAMEAFEQNRTFVGLDLWQVSQQRPEQAAELLERCVGWIRDGKINAGAIARAFSADQVQDAFRFMQGGRHIGIKTRPLPNLRSDRSYILVGGLGGLGRSLATWMAENGAGELIFLSRSAQPGPKLDGYVTELASQGCSVQLVAGSVSDMADVQRTVQSATKPIAGVINLSMVLRDITLQDMSFQDWMTAVAPKVQGTWNLHNAISSSLDFFVLCSSYSGIVGQWGQANYAAANTFLDAFVQYRHSKGLAASVIDIGVMGEVGFVSKNREVLDMFQKSGMRILKEKDLLDAFNLAIQRSKAPEAQGANGAYDISSQILLGLVTTIPVASPNSRVVWKKDIRMSIYHNISGADDSSSKAETEQDSVSTLLSAAANSPSILEEEETTSIIAQAIASSLANFLIRDVDSIKADLSPEKNGVDSLVAMELRNWIRQKFNVESSVMIIVQSPSLNGLAEHIRLGLVERFSQA
ncbi:KR domain-containing protein [Trichoderma gamsii]|uniref:KR domain-containing protein n=1 Tax=Trichoderma gamsii TaxID=398673 RepID=A0A2P4ZJR5_9HYPO|nr:KR domain-containing protein [Trichoderma gamsii]PON24523.1 KR domain-containing protein [Trichoderma gamsii]